MLRPHNIRCLSPSRASAGKAAGSKRAGLVSKGTPYWMSVLEVALTFALPVILILGAISSGKASLLMPGKPGDDLRLHALAR